MSAVAAWGFVLAGCTACCLAASAAPSEGADPALAPWFQSLQVPATGESCCSVADCRQVQYRVRNNHFQAYIGGSFPRWTRAPYAWVEIPDSHVLHRRDNPTGEGVACWHDGQVLCFVPGSGT